MIIWAHIAGLIGYFAMGVALLILLQLSKRLGGVTHARPYYWVYYISIALIWGGILVRLLFITIGQSFLQAANIKLVYTLMSDGLPAVGITIGLIVTWHYWSWLLAERD
jgi:divalent metal cation (Fe/Co/Zn/Cd) transporter